MAKRKPKPQAPFRLELISQPMKGHDQPVPIGIGLFDTARGEVTQIYPLDAKVLDRILPANGAFRLSTELNEIKSVTTEFGVMDSAQMIDALPEFGARFPDLDTFKNRPGLAITMFRANDRLHKYAKHTKLGYALTDKKTGEILRYIAESQMRQMLNHLGATKVRAGKHNTLTSITLEDGEKISAKEFIDMLVGTERPEEPRPNHLPVVAAAAFAAASIVAMTGDSPQTTAKPTADFSLTAAHSVQHVEVIRRKPGADAMASYDAIRNPELRAMVSHWFIHGEYADLAARLSDIGMEELENEDPIRAEVLKAEADAIKHEMVWQVEVVRAADTLWRKDGAKMRASGFKSPVEMALHELAFAKIESEYGRRMTNTVNPTVQGFYHFNDDTFMDMVRAYKRTHGNPSALRGKREDILKLRNDAYWATIMRGEYIKAFGKDYGVHVMGVGGYRVLCRMANDNSDTSMQHTSLEAAAYDNPSILLNKTANQALGILTGRFQSALNFVSNKGWKAPVSQPRQTVVAQQFDNARTGQALKAHREQNAYPQTRNARQGPFRLIARR